MGVVIPKDDEADTRDNKRTKLESQDHNPCFYIQLQVGVKLDCKSSSLALECDWYLEV